MSEMTERERAVFSSRRNVFDGGRHHRDETKEALYFIAMHDALTAYDAAQKAADPSAPALARKMAEDRLGLLRAVTQKPADPATQLEGAKLAAAMAAGRFSETLRPALAAVRGDTDPSDPVATVREAMGRLDKSGWSNAMPAVVWHVDRWRHPEGRSAHCDTSDGALATILNALPALLERAERPSLADVQDLLNRWEDRYETGYREGVIKGLEREMERWEANAEKLKSVQLTEAGKDRLVNAEANAERLRCEIARIKDGGPIETGGEPQPSRFDIIAHLQRQREWSERTFGPGSRRKGVVDHIRKELLEIEADGDDTDEWIDVIILGFDGAWRSGKSPEQIIEKMVAKQTKNEARQWPDWRTIPADKAIEHVRGNETGGTTSGPGALAGQGCGLTAPEGQTQAGGAPGLPLPKGWVDKEQLDAMRWLEYDNMRDRTTISTKFLRQVTRMAGNALKLRDELQKVADSAPAGKLMDISAENAALLMRCANDARQALASLETDNG